MNSESVRAYVDAADSVLNSSPQMDEANTKAALLRDFLELLGWQIPENTQLEYSVQAFGQTYKVDYALVLEGAPVAFLEAKGADTALTTGHENQLTSYMTNENVNYGILTNGEEYRFFRRQVDSADVEVQKVADVALEVLPRQHAILGAYEKSAIESGESDKILGRISELRDARRRLKEEKDELSNTVARTLSDRVSDTISPMAKSQSKEMIDRLVEDIEVEIDGGNGGSDGGGGKGGDGPHPGANHIVGKKARSMIEGSGDDRVAVFPAKQSGIEFLRENNAWGFVSISQNPGFVAIYVTEGESEVRYIAQVKEIVPATEADLARAPKTYDESGSEDAQAGFDPNQKVVVFEEESLFELEDPVPFETKYPQSLQYTTLDALKAADTTDDML